MSRMTLGEKLAFVGLAAGGGYENRNAAIARLCIPSLTLSDGPNGISYGMHGVTQLPASLGIAASFDTALAYRYGQVEGLEARGKGIDVVQGPELNLDRVPESGRAFEAYGEDPDLTAALGVADVEGIQSEGVMSDAKHFTAYNQETARLLVDQVVAPRALEELYLAPFRAVVEQAHGASLMCAYGELDGVNDCSSPLLYKTLSSWGFEGFVRSDLGAVGAPAPAFRAGLAMIKPAAATQLRNALADRQLGIAQLDGAVRRVLGEMFAFHMIGRPPTGRADANVATAADAEFAREAAESSIVLLKNSHGVLPLDPGRLRSVAVIGADAGRATMSAGYGSARTWPSHLVTPLLGLASALGRHVKLTYSPGGDQSLLLPGIPGRELSAPQVLPSGPEPPSLTGKDPEGVADLESLRSPRVTLQAATATLPRAGSGWTSWTGTLTPSRSGLYTFSLTQRGDTWFTIDGSTVLRSAGLHGPAPWSASIPLVAGRRYRLEVRWFAVSPAAEPRLGMAYQSPGILAAVRAARAARVAVVFVNDFNSEGVDRPNLSLPGDQNALVTAVAEANPRTVVVLETGGPVLMPWLQRVAAVLEAWYPGEQGGRAIASVLIGRFDPAGHLPVTFPASEAAVPARTAAAYPGVDSVVRYSEGLDIGYRYDQVHHLTPLFPFGFGLSYTSFSISHVSARAGRGAELVQMTVRDTGPRSGTAVVQAYLGYPKAAGEPPLQLRAFSAVSLRAGGSRTLTLRLTRRAFEAYLGGRFRTLPGRYQLEIGQSSANLPLRLSIEAPATPGRARGRAA